jgi:secondary thiamine-phosphate synthase enzyme
MKTRRLRITTGRERALVDLTPEVQEFVRLEGDGFLNISIPHATAGLILMELGSGSEADLWDRVDALLPRDHRYVHSHGSSGHGADHLLPAFISPTLTLPVIAGEVSLGTWQSIALIDPNVDNPQREVMLAFLSDSTG